MGVALWVLCGVAVFALSRAIAPGRSPRFAAELILTLLVSFVAGLAATALDFGGWAELDWRAGAFAACCAFAAIAIARSIRLTSRSVVRN